MAQSTLSRPGVMLEVFGQGVLLQAKSGGGKSDLALDLVDRGHCLIADDLIEFHVQNNRLVAACRSGFEGFLEIAGLGILNLVDFYGERAIKPQAILSLVLKLDTWSEDDYDRLQPAQESWQMQGINVPAWRLPAVTQRNMPLIVETAVRLNLARQQGYDASSDFQARLTHLMKQKVA